MRKFKCIKEVSAEAILSASLVDTGSEYVAKFVLANGKTYQCKPSIFTRYAPKEGDYLVIYQNGYVSVNPKEVFEDGYVEIEKC